MSKLTSAASVVVCSSASNRSKGVNGAMQRKLCKTEMCNQPTAKRSPYCPAHTGARHCQVSTTTQTPTTHTQAEGGRVKPTRSRPPLPLLLLMSDDDMTASEPLPLNWDCVCVLCCAACSTLAAPSVPRATPSSASRTAGAGAARTPAAPRAPGTRTSVPRTGEGSDASPRGVPRSVTRLLPAS